MLSHPTQWSQRDFATTSEVHATDRRFRSPRCLNTDPLHAHARCHHADASVRIDRRRVTAHRFIRGLHFIVLTSRRFLVDPRWRTITTLAVSAAETLSKSAEEPPGRHA